MAKRSDHSGGTALKTRPRAGRIVLWVLLAALLSAGLGWRTAFACIGAFCGVLPSEPFRAACAALAAMGVCGEIAEARRLQNGTGNATFRTDLIDAVFNLTEEQLTKGVRYEVYEG